MVILAMPLRHERHAHTANLDTATSLTYVEGKWFAHTTNYHLQCSRLVKWFLHGLPVGWVT